MRRLVHLLIAHAGFPIAARGEVDDDALYPALCLLILLRFHAVPENVAAGAGELADYLKVHAGAPPAENLDVVLAHHGVELRPSGCQATLEAAVGILLLRTPPSRPLFLAMGKAEATYAVCLDAAVLGVPVHNQLGQLCVQFLITARDLGRLPPGKWGFGADVFVTPVLGTLGDEVLHDLLV